jgi:hypothetical protein
LQGTVKGAGILDSTRNIHTNDNAGANIECYLVQLVVQDTLVQFADIIGPSVLLLASIRAVGNVEIGQIYMQAGYLKALLTSDESTPFKPPPNRSLPTELAEKLYVVWTKDFEPEEAVRLRGLRTW